MTKKTIADCDLALTDLEGLVQECCEEIDTIAALAKHGTESKNEVLMEHALRAFPLIQDRANRLLNCVSGEIRHLRQKLGLRDASAETEVSNA